jgi:T5SS/PEP-CTERM-associated repeat protein
MQSKKMGYMSAIILAALLVQPAAAVDINVNTAITTSTNFNGVLRIGANANNVAVTMTSGATVQDTEGTISDNRTFNSVTVSDAGSIWTNTSWLAIGRGGSGSHDNLLVITNGGKVYDTSSSIGNNAGGGDANRNKAIVTGSGSLWYNSSYMTLGQGSDNSLVVTNGGCVYNAGDCVLGTNSRNSGNKIVVTGSGSIWTNNGTIKIANGGSSGDCKNNSVTIANGGKVYANAIDVAAYNASGSTPHRNNGISVADTGSLLYVNGRLIIGGTPDANSKSELSYMIITNGGFVYSTSGNIGLNGANSINTVTITGSGSIWTNTGTLNFGSAFNKLIITNGSKVYNTAVNIGGGAGANSNTGTVTDAGSVWNLGNNNMTIGVAGAIDNALTVANNGVVTNVNALTINATNTLNLLGGTVYASSLSMGVGAKIGFDRTKPGSLKLSGTATLNGTLDLAAFNLPPGTKEIFNVLTCSGTPTGSLTLAGATPPAGQFATLTTKDGAVVVTMWRPSGTLIRFY